MQLSVQTPDFKLTPALKQFIEQQARRIFKPVAEDDPRVSVVLRDISGPKGGKDKECAVEVSLPRQPAVIVKKRSSDVYAVIRKCLGRAARSSLRKNSKRKRF